MTVVSMFAEDHGFIGVAMDYHAVIFFLIQSGWLDDTCRVIDKNNDEYDIDELYGDEWRTLIETWDINTFNNNVVSFTLEEIYAHP